MGRVVKSFSYDTKTDRDLSIKIDTLEHGELSAVVRDALRAYWQLERTTATLDDVYKAVKGLERKLDAGIVIGTGSGQEVNDPGDPGADVAGTEGAAANLDAWGQ